MDAIFLLMKNWTSQKFITYSTFQEMRSSSPWDYSSKKKRTEAFMNVEV